ncbi:MAG TPA: hypothetical protein PKM54_05615, partial [Anaerolineales bacterium]|nr:hypothetical protein [Anaerolineales bacterium]
MQTQSFNITQAGASPPVRVVAAQDATIEWGQTGVVAVQLAAQGDENAVGFSLSFDTALLVYAGASLGSGASGAMLNVNTNQL